MLGMNMLCSWGGGRRGRYKGLDHGQTAPEPHDETESGTYKATVINEKCHVPEPTSP